MKISITGASGFVGTSIKKYLEDYHEINPMIVRYSSNQQFDITGDVLIHLAGKAHDIKKVSKPKDYYEANFELTKQLFDSFLKSDIKVFIFMSTVKAVTDKAEIVLNEEQTPDPKTHYGIAKQQAEEYILSQQVSADKKVFILRPCMIHGPGNKGNLNLLYQLATKGMPWPLGSFENTRSFLSIENLCFIIKEIIENKEIPSGTYNLADNSPLSTNELMYLIGASLNRKVSVWNINTSIINNIAKLGDYLKLPLNSERLEKLTENYVVSNDKIRNAIGKPLPLDSKEGLLKTFQSFKNNKL